MLHCIHKLLWYIWFRLLTLATAGFGNENSNMQLRLLHRNTKIAKSTITQTLNETIARMGGKKGRRTHPNYLEKASTSQTNKSKSSLSLPQWREGYDCLPQVEQVS